MLRDKIFISTIFLISCILLLPGLVAAQTNWELKRNKNDIQIYTRVDEKDPVKEYKAIALISAPYQVVFNFNLDLENRTKWVYQCSEVKVFERTGDSLVSFYSVFDLPWPAEDRCLIAKTRIISDSAAGYYRVLTKEYEDAPDYRDELTRFTLYREDQKIEGIAPGKTMISVEGKANPGGKIPTWLINIFLVDGIYDSMITLREFLENEYEQE